MGMVQGGKEPVPGSPSSAWPTSTPNLHDPQAQEKVQGPDLIEQSSWELSLARRRRTHHKFHPAFLVHFTTCPIFSFVSDLSPAKPKAAGLCTSLCTQRE